MIVKCDIVKCDFNYSGFCRANVLEIVPNHILMPGDPGYFEYITCSTYVKLEHHD